MAKLLFTDFGRYRNNLEVECRISGRIVALSINTGILLDSIATRAKLIACAGL